MSKLCNEGHFVIDTYNNYSLKQAHNKGISSLVMLSEGTLLSGGDKDRKIIAWDSLQNYKKVTEAKVSSIEAFLRISLN